MPPLPCGLTWHYDPVYDHPPHPDHDCGKPSGHGGDHQCSRCDCWITPEAIAQFGTWYKVG